MASSASIPFNKTMFRWAREWRHRTVEDAARKVKKTAAQIEAWEDENNEDIPTVKQARALAALYERPFLEFFWDQPPPVSLPELVPDFRFRRQMGIDEPHERRELVEIQAWAESQRVNALDLYELMDERPPAFPDVLSATVRSDEESVATLVRNSIGFEVAEQQELETKDKLPPLLRRYFERIGVLVLKNSTLREYAASGFCLAKFPLPVIVFSNEYPAAQSFTICHEFAHILLRQSAISGPLTPAGGDQGARSVEEWCNRFAAAFLIPQEALQARYPKPRVPAHDISDQALKELALVFKVSEHAMIIRLVHTGRVAAPFYWDKKRAELLKQEREYKPFGRAKYYGTRYRNTHGDLYTGLVLDAWSSGRITNHNAAEFMGIKSIRHLEDIRSNFSRE